MNATNPTNPFLIAEVSEACNEARTVYLDTLARRQSGSDSVDWLERLAQQSHQRLDTNWDTALSLAFADQVRGVNTQFVVIVKEWGLYRALTDLLDAGEQGLYLDPDHPDTYGDIQRLLEHQVVYLATELLNEWQRGWEQRRADQLQRQQDWQAQAFEQVQQTMQHQTAWHDVALRMAQEQQNAWQAGQRSAQQWSDVALNGVEQAQRGVEQMYTFAATVHTSVAGMLAGTEERQYMIVDEAVDRATWRQKRSRLVVVLMIAVAIPLLFGLAYFLVTHLY